MDAEQGERRCCVVNFPPLRRSRCGAKSGHHIVHAFTPSAIGVLEAVCPQTAYQEAKRGPAIKADVPRLEAIFPGLGAAISVREVGTPRSHRRFWPPSGQLRGPIPALAPARACCRCPFNRHRIPNPLTASEIPAFRQGLNAVAIQRFACGHRRRRRSGPQPLGPTRVIAPRIPPQQAKRSLVRIDWPIRNNPNGCCPSHPRKSLLATWKHTVGCHQASLWLAAAAWSGSASFKEAERDDRGCGGDEYPTSAFKERPSRPDADRYLLEKGREAENIEPGERSSRPSRRMVEAASACVFVAACRSRSATRSRPLIRLT